MSERPTPETDAFIERNIGHGPTGWEWRVHSRRLERERDEAREALAEEIKHHIETTEKWNGHHFDLTIALSDLNKTLRERDEARETIIGWENKWKCAVEMAARAEVERDELRDFADELQLQINNLRKELGISNRALDDAIREREELKGLQDILEKLKAIGNHFIKEAAK